MYGHGLFMEGAGWEDGKGDEEGYVTESKLKDLHPQMPICNVYAVHVDEMSWDCMYRCPVYVTSLRGPDYVFAANVTLLGCTAISSAHLAAICAICCHSVRLVGC